MPEWVRSYVTAASLILLLSGSGVAAETVSEVPNPRITRGSYVEDSAGVLGTDYASLINQVSSGIVICRSQC